MTITELKYKLSNGFIHNWLVAGPHAIPVTNPTTDLNKDHRLEIIRQYSVSDAGISEKPVDLGSLGQITQENPGLTWKYYRCREDHFVDFSAYYATIRYLRSWVYAQVVIPTSRAVGMVITTNAPVDYWLNGQLRCRLEFIQDLPPKSNVISTILQPGANELLFRLENIGMRETPYVMALQIQGLADDDLDIVIPTTIATELLSKHKILENVIDKAYLDRYVYGNLWGDRYNKNQPIPLNFASDLDVSDEITFRLQSLSGNIFQEGTKTFGAGSSYELAKTFPLRNGPHHLALLPTADEYYIKKIRFDRRDLFYIVRTPYSQTPYNNYKQRVKEALSDASQRRNENLYCEIAKIAISQWQLIDQQIVSHIIDGMNLRNDGSVRDLLGFLGLMLRFGRGGKISRDIKSKIKKSILKYRYWEDQPGADVMNFKSESEQILFHTCEILAGQLYPEATFTNTGMNGEWHKDHGEKLAVDWLRYHGQYGFWEWDSPGNYEVMLAALSHLVDLAKSGTIRELAAVLMDKMFFSMAVNSIKGAYGSTRGKTDTASILSVRLEPTSGIYRLMWGMGNFNESVMGTVSLACCKQYELPDIIRKIGEESPKAFWNREHQGGDAQSIIPGGVDKVSYRTKDFFLSSAQDYHPGERGQQEHIWQATLGPDSIIYVNHPVCMSEDDAHRPNLWSGNGVLPRVVQWGDVLIAIYKIPQNDWLGFTHAYFPAVTFDDYQIQGKWAFARKGDGYLALTAACGFTFIQSGQTAFRELRSIGLENIWVCHMGQKMLDGSFNEFQQKIINLNISFNSLSVNLTSLRGDVLSFGWEGPFWVNDQEQAITKFKHYENPYCIVDLPASQMDIIYQEEGLRLKFR